jgi:hypothetical protein
LFMCDLETPSFRLDKAMLPWAMVFSTSVQHSSQ